MNSLTTCFSLPCRVLSEVFVEEFLGGTKRVLVFLECICLPPSLPPPSVSIDKAVSYLNTPCLPPPGERYRC